MIDLSRIRYELPGRVLFDDLSLRIDDTDRVALVGPNGSGKTTLLKLMCTTIQADSGQVSRTRGASIGYLPQDGIVHRGRSILAEARSVFEDLLNVQSEIEALEKRLEDGLADEESLIRYSEAIEHFRSRGGYEIDARVASVLDGLGFAREDWQRDAGVLSGGWQMRLALAKLLISSPSLLLLDEPTNHLDLLANNWLETYLKSYAGGFLLVSHDRHFLDHVVTHVAELRFGKARVYRGNYTHYLKESEKELEILEERKRRQDERIEKVERFVEKFRYKATKAKQVQSRIKELDKIERIELPQAQASVSFRFPDPPRSGRRVIELEQVRKAYADKLVFANLDLVVERGERLALVGPNGAGKSTLMRILAGREAHEGGRKLGHNVSLAYFAQDEGATLDASATVLEEVTKVAPVSVVSQLRTLLGTFLFRGDDVFKSVGVLSGGERTRVALARMLLEPRNLLLLDEPTNHLDLASKEVLLNSLLDFPGTIVVVSHDRYFLDRLATRVAQVGNGEVITYPGGYEEYLEWSARQQAAAPAPGSSRPPDKPAPKPEKGNAARDSGGTPKKSAKPARAPRAGKEGRASSEQRVKLERRIEDMEAEVRRLEDQMAAPGFFADPSSRQHVERHKSLMWQVRELYEEWEAL